MPIYEYKCKNCEQRLEKLQRMSDDPLVDCPECGKPSLTKLVSASSFKLKGSGWYETDFKNKAGASSTTQTKEKNDSDKSKIQDAKPDTKK